MQRFALDLRLMMPLQQRTRKCPQDKKCKYGDRTKLLVTVIGVRLGGVQWREQMSFKYLCRTVRKNNFFGY
jgi:hypothetical protein